jgi:hypothetical protein
MPTDPSCYVSGPTGPGAECLAVRDNRQQDRYQFRQVWSRSVTPPGSASVPIYGVLVQRQQLPHPECNMASGVSGYILLLDWDRSDPDITKHTVRTGFADFVRPEDMQDVLQNGMCFAEFMYSAPEYGLPEPGWEVKPVLARRRATDFTVEEVRGTVPEGEGVVYMDEEKGIAHGYSPLAYVVIFDLVNQLIAIPIRDVETRNLYNAPDNPNCQGVYRADKLDVNNQCASADPENAAWGCVDDACPGEGPNVTQGHFRIVDIEKVFNKTLNSTLCVTYMGQPEAVALGWANPSDTNWGNRCSKSPLWNPDDPVNGLPMGDWCSATNSEATRECHDSWRSVSYSAMQAFPVRDGACTPQGYPPIGG